MAAATPTSSPSFPAGQPPSTITTGASTDHHGASTKTAATFLLLRASFRSHHDRHPRVRLRITNISLPSHKVTVLFSTTINLKIAPSYSGFKLLRHRTCKNQPHRGTMGTASRRDNTLSFVNRKAATSTFIAPLTATPRSTSIITSGTHSRRAHLLAAAIHHL
ncbi:hypothetical protein LR48_Vigan257s000700 [Vigna angularis]|uniref:Uncharacterized protein n=1 Tax=Phaseolus angularis TaxID=3914 RepID=A0A0L9T7N3_PHAAN|nr:hypothetical protein LR48_Vigan257s000700 [Vigna angularis]